MAVDFRLGGDDWFASGDVGDMGDDIDDVDDNEGSLDLRTA